MKLVMFDIDGTLTESNTLDGAAYLKALAEVFEFSQVSNDWTSYSHVTDAGVLKEVYQLQRGCIPSPVEVKTFQERFFELLQNGAAVSGGVIAVPGASEVLNQLLASPDYAVAYAGGGWAASALFKLQSASLPIMQIPYAFSDDADSREEIMTIARARAEAYYGESFSRIIYIGDGIWDIRSAQALDYSFIGIAKGDRAQELMNAGAIHVFPDYRDTELILTTLEIADSE